MLKRVAVVVLAAVLLGSSTAMSTAAPAGASEPAPPSPSPPSPPTAGPRIVGGGGAGTGEYPYFVSIRRASSGFAFCGGTLISSTRVLTAGHCFDPIPATSSINVRIGGTTC